LLKPQDASKRFLILLILFGPIWNLVLWSALQVKASIDLNQVHSANNLSIAEYPKTFYSDYNQSRITIQSMINTKQKNLNEYWIY